MHDFCMTIVTFAFRNDLVSFHAGTRIGLSRGRYRIAKGRGAGMLKCAAICGRWEGVEGRLSPPPARSTETFNATSDPRREWHSNVKAPKNGTRTFDES